MQSTTLAIGILGSVLVLLLRPPLALGAYIGVLVWYPDYLRVSIGTIDISVGRIVVTVLLLRCLCNDGICKKFIWSRLDTLVSLSMVVYVGMYCFAHPSLSRSIENQSGFLMDTLLSYFVARLCIMNFKGAVTAIKCVAIILFPLALLGIVEATTGWQPFTTYIQYCPWVSEYIPYNARWGFTRAWGPFSHPILFGSCFVLVMPLIWALRHQHGYWGKLAYFLSGIAILGAFSSMSSNPWGMLVVVVLCLVLEKYKHWTKIILASLVMLCILTEIGSNRPFYHVIYSYINFAKGDWWQRARLVDIAIEHIDEWWLAGYGGKDPGWGQLYFWAAFTDCNNEFLLIGLKTGIIGIVSLCAVLITAFRALARAFKETTDKELQSLYWSMGSSLVGVIVVWQGVSFFGQMPALFYSFLGIMGSSIGFARYNDADRRLLKTSYNNLILSYGRVK